MCSEWEWWPPSGPWSQLRLSALNLPCSFPPSHCPFDDVLTKAKRAEQHYSVKELGRFLLFSLSKDEKAKSLDLTDSLQLQRDWESCSSAFKSNCSSRRRGRMRLQRNTEGSEGRWLCSQQNRAQSGGEGVLCQLWNDGSCTVNNTWKLEVVDKLLEWGISGRNEGAR